MTTELATETASASAAPLVDASANAGPTSGKKQKPQGAKKQGPKPQAATPAGNARDERRSKFVQRVARKAPQYDIFATIVERTVRVGDARLAFALFGQWPDIHHALHYLTDFTRTRVKGKVVAAANRGIAGYLDEKTHEAEAMLKWANNLADENGIKLGRHSKTKEQVLEVACHTENRVLRLVRTLDDFVIVVDSLWIAELIDDAKHDDSHQEVVRIINVLSTLLKRMREKMIRYRHERADDRLSRDEEAAARDLEHLIYDISGVNAAQLREQEEAAERKAAKAAKPRAAKPNQPQPPEEAQPALMPTPETPQLAEAPTLQPVEGTERQVVDSASGQESQPAMAA